MLEFRVLGPLEVWRDGERVALAAARERAVLAALLLQANRVVSADRLIELLWGDEAVPAKARNTVHTWVWRLRRRLEPPEVFVTRPPGYLLRIEPEQLDVFRFEGLLRQGRRALAAGEVARAAGLLSQASALWRGEPLADVAAPRLREVEGARLSELHLQAVEARVEAELGLGRAAELVGELRRLVADHPLREALYGQLMTALYRSGRQAEALETFRVLRRLLADQLAVEPGPALQRLHLAMLRMDPELSEGTQPEAPVAATTPDAPTAAAMAPAARPATVPAQLPAAVPAFTGRAGCLAQLDAVLAGDDPGAMAICAIAGTAGVGKTALAVHWAHHVAHRFPDGQLYVNLRGYDAGQPVRPVEALARFLRALGVQSDQAPETLEEAAGMYRSLLTGRRVLVVLDNADSAEQVRPLLPGSPGCLVVVTSRDRLTGLVARDGARRLAVDVLSPAEAVALLERIIGAERMRAEPQATEELAHTCGYLPLALRIAAANLANHPHEPIADLVAELRAGDRLGALHVDGDEQSAVRTAFDQSYAALPDDTRRMFRLLGLVPGADFTVEAAAVLADTAPAQARRMLNRLESAHLVEAPTPGRHTFHDLLRLYAKERGRAEDGDAERAAAAARLDAWYLRRIDAAARRLYPEMLRLPGPAPVPADQAEQFADRAAALAWLDAERANVVSAVRHAADRGSRETAWLLADWLRGYFWIRRHTVDWLTAAQVGRAAAEAAGETKAVAAADISLGLAYRSLTRDAESVAHYERAVALTEQVGWAQGQAGALNNLACVYIMTGQLTDAAELLNRALDLNWKAGLNPTDRVFGLCNLGHVYLRLGRLERARELCVESLAVADGSRGKHSDNNILLDLGEICHGLGLFDEALRHLGRATTLFQDHGDLDGEAMARCATAAVHRDAGRYQPAIAHVQAARELADRTGDRYTEAVTRTRLGAILLKLGRGAEAVLQQTRALQLGREANATRAQSEALIGLAAALRHQGRRDRARRAAQDAIALTRKVGYRVYEAQARTALAEIHLDAGDGRRAAVYAREALEISRETGHRLGEAGALLVLGQALGGEAAVAAWRDALAIAAALDVPEAERLRALLGAVVSLESVPGC